MSMTMTQLRSFLAVVRGGSVTAAADELVVTQPSVSAAVSALSREVGCALTERDGRGIRPTAAGSVFAAYATDVVGLLDEGARAAREAAGHAERRLALAAVTTAAESFVPPLMRAFGTAHPDLRLTLTVGNRERVMDLVLGHRADVAIGGRPPGDDRIVATPIRPNELVLVTAPDDPLARGARCRRQELARRVWLLREPGSGTRAVTARFLATASLEPETLKLGSNGAIRQAARAGLGIAYLSRAAVAVELDAGLLACLTVDRPPPERHVVRHALVRRTGPPCGGRFMAFAASPAGW